MSEKPCRSALRCETLVEGQPELLVHNGKVLDHALAKAGMTRHDLMAGLRASGVASIEDIHAAVLETNGRISVIERSKNGNNAWQRRADVLRFHYVSERSRSQICR